LAVAGESCFSVARESDCELVDSVGGLCWGALCDFAHIAPGLSGSSAAGASVIEGSGLLI
jgi:hypothetical protein